MPRQSAESVVPIERITRTVLLVRNQRVLLDAELAALYGVTTEVLHSERAIAVNIQIMRACVRMRGLLTSNKELARKLAALERSLAALDAGTRRRFEEVYAAIRALMTPAAPKRRPIGFTADLEELS